MLETISYLRTRSEIKTIDKLDNGLIAIRTMHHGARIFSISQDESLKTITNEHLNGSTTAASFSPDGELLAFSDPTSIYILHIQSKVIIKTIRTEGEYVQNLKFDPESKYIIASTQSGRILQYRYDGSSLIARLYSFKPINRRKSATATTFAFHEKVMACGGDNGVVFLINLHSRANKISFSNTNTAITSICFLDSQNIISGDTSGNIYFNSLKDTSLTKKIEIFSLSITNIKMILNYLIMSKENSL